MNILSTFLTSHAVDHIVIAANKNNKEQAGGGRHPKQIVPDMFRVDKVDGLTDETKIVAFSLLAAIANGTPFQELETIGVQVPNSSNRLRFHFDKMPGNKNFKGIWYTRYADHAANRNWRFYYIVGSTHVALLDIFDKNSNQIDKNQVQRLVSLIRKFKMQSGEQ